MKAQCVAGELEQQNESLLKQVSQIAGLKELVTELTHEKHVPSPPCSCEQGRKKMEQHCKIVRCLFNWDFIKYEQFLEFKNLRG